MGCVSGGVAAVEWSPEGDVVVLVTGEGRLMVMTSDLEPLAEAPLHPDEFGEGDDIETWGMGYRNGTV